MWRQTTGAPTLRESEQALRCVTTIQDVQRWTCRPNSRDPRQGTDVAAHLQYNCGNAFHSEVVGPKSEVFMDFRTNRFTIHTDKDGKCTSMEMN